MLTGATIGDAVRGRRIVLPGRTLTADLVANNPGQWMIHCHNTYHAEAGMATILGYQV
ncbi:MAG TPA: multicopper oxidase domain-containing protein [Amycolatopsis sp.]|uniref:multicopper oxidase domain-containing protein n=1 Tax=Amycolatopsis sp. TaxID=37632 RepID=UPI002B45D520|nr:multicopper oxidase domain-containing protein [Amycolatopsis sp.]HKS43686.1 multicopper oxidase domain-containing protein [Amycolatopsis sp.]